MGSTKQVKYVGQPIVFIGFMGCGKTTLAKLLARRLRLNFVDLDQAIVKRDGRAIPRIFKESGEKAFRQLETAALKRELKPGRVVATGGGVPSKIENRRLLKSKGALVIWIDPSWAVLWRRLQSSDKKSRPLLAQIKSQIQTLFDQRLSYYEKTAQVRIAVSAKHSEKDTLKKIMKLFAS